MRLAAGTKLAQTRRSIDVKGASRKHGVIPAFVIIGGQKCGTTLLYECLNQHPLVIRGCKRETHFFDWAWQPQLEKVEQQRKFCELGRVEEACLADWDWLVSYGDGKGWSVSLERVRDVEGRDRVRLCCSAAKLVSMSTVLMSGEISSTL